MQKITVLCVGKLKETFYEQAVKASGCQYYVIANVTAQ